MKSSIHIYGIQLECIILSVAKQSQKEKYVLPHMWNLANNICKYVSSVHVGTIYHVETKTRKAKYQGMRKDCVQGNEHKL